MLKAVVSFVIILVLAGIVGSGAAMAHYRSPDPCRMLAVERAKNDRDGITGMLGEEVLNRLHRSITAQMSTHECMTALAEEWWHDLSAQADGADRGSDA